MLWSLICTIVVGAISGFIAGKIMKSEGSLLRNIILGILGGIVGGFLGRIIGIGATGLVGGIIISVIGACLLIWIAQKIF